MDDKKANTPTPTPNSSDTFKSTNIYASKASNQADYFAHVQPTLQDKIRKKAQDRKAVLAVKSQDPAFQKRKRKIIVAILAILIIAALAAVSWLVYVNFIQPAIEEQRTREERTAVQEGSEEQPNTIASVRQRAIELARSDSSTALEEATDLLEGYLAETDDPEALFALQMTAAEIKATYGDAEQGINDLLALDNGELNAMSQYLLYKTITAAYHAGGNEDQAAVYHQKALAVRDAANQNQELEKHGL